MFALLPIRGSRSRETVDDQLSGRRVGGLSIKPILICDPRSVSVDSNRIGNIAAKDNRRFRDQCKVNSLANQWLSVGNGNQVIVESECRRGLYAR